MISATEHKKILIQTRTESIQAEIVPFGFRSLMEPSIQLGEARQDRFSY